MHHQASQGANHSSYTPDERALLLNIARQSLAERGAGRLYQPSGDGLPGKLQQHRGCFVTLFRNQELRGCIGQVHARLPLFEAVAQNACAAAFNDSRFEPVNPGEVPQLTVEISVLSELILLEGNPEDILLQLRPGIDGVLLERDSEVVTFLPQVWSHLSDKVQFLQRLCQKAGWETDAWKEPGTRLSAYQVESFEEHPAGE
jgi:AmmeMemoRadiSam system protein A